ncbi:hypothetical protein OAR11_04290 [Alphaproteobacteria bacterium]|nr:hypothetical protein [Alphaproteobacteria bacterium]MDC1037007.1 hypothetical protein [Alphaproteobacteria bacterium]
MNYPNIRHYGESQLPLVMFRIIIRATAQPRHGTFASPRHGTFAQSRHGHDCLFVKVVCR